MRICIQCKHPVEDTRAVCCSSCGNVLGERNGDHVGGAVMGELEDANDMNLNATLDAGDLKKTTLDSTDNNSNSFDQLTNQREDSSRWESTIDTKPPIVAIDPTSTIQLDFSVDQNNPSTWNANPAEAVIGGETLVDSSSSKEDASSFGTLDAPQKDPTGMADFSVDAVGISPMATIHINHGQITKRSEPFGSPNTMKGGPTFRSDHDSELSSSIWSTISRRKLGTDKEVADVSADYKIVRKLGEGGMGVVYVARQKSLDREVAVKAIKSGQANTEESRKKFFYEAQITGELDHPNIVPIHELGANDDGTLFYSMKMVDGSPWEDAIKNKSREANLEIFMKVCDAIAFAHSHDVIHRDLKPENVMLGTFGEVLVMDWGLAVDLKTKPIFGMSGTPAYMSPEMASHQVSKIGKTSDIYILGGILFQILTGRAPHTGKSVRDCLVNAQLNRIIPTELDDPLLDIARVALSTDPSDRYDSVQAFQTAIREHLQHAESISLSKRANETLEHAIAERNYKGFSRAVFSMQEAIDMWPSNEAAIKGLSIAQLAYGQCALEQGDYDLCIQCLESTNPEHADLLMIAREKKQVVLQRESRLRWMRRTLASVITIATLLLSGATYYANYQASVARKQEKIAKEAAQAEKAAKDNESIAKLAAIEDRNKAMEAAEQERVAKQNEAKAREQAQVDRDAAIVARETAEVAKEKEAAARQVAVAAEKQATEARNQAVENARYTMLGNYQSLLGLSMSQNLQFNVQRSNQLLRDVDRVEKDLEDSFDQLPRSEAPIAFLKNWAYRRIELLNNADIEKVSLSAKRPVIDIARNSPYAVVSSEEGSVEIAKWNSQSWIPCKKISVPGPVVAVAISNDGQQVAIVIKAETHQPGLFHWNTSEHELIPFQNAPSVGLEVVRFVDDGRSVIAGINSGIWKWTSPTAIPSRIEIRGRLSSLECFDRDQSKGIGVLSIPNADVSCVRFDWLLGTAAIIPLPTEIMSQLSAAGMSQDGQTIYLGARDGRLWYGRFSGSEQSNTMQRGVVTKLPVSMVSMIQVDNLSEVSPRKHTAAIHGIRTTSDNRILTYGDEPVAHVWQHKNRNTMPLHECYLAGLPENVAYSQFADHAKSIVALDSLGGTMTWSINDQMNRQSNASMNSVAPAILVSESDGEQLWIDEKGTVLTESKKYDSDTSVTDRQYFGHSPGAEITDTCIATTKPWIATVARVRGAALDYLAKDREQIEVCVWNVAEGRLVQRQHIESDRIGRASFVDDDHSVLVTDGTAIHFVDMESLPKQSVRETKDLKFGAALAVTNPNRPSQIALIAKSGAIRILDLNLPSSWNDEAYRYLDLAINNRNEPVHAVWSQNGDRLYVLFDHGGLTRLEWTGDRFTSVQSAESADLKCQSPTLPWKYVDALVSQSTESVDALRFCFRSDAAGFGTKETLWNWSIEETKPTSVSVLQTPEEKFLQTNGELLAWTRTNWLPNAEIAGVKRSSDRTIAILKNGNLAISRNVGEATKLVGRQSCLRASISQDHRRLILCQSNQSIIIGQRFSSKVFDWSNLEHDLDLVQDCEISPDGSRFVILGMRAAKKIMLEFEFRAETRELKRLHAIESAEKTVWHPERKQFLFLTDRQSLESIGPDDQWNLDLASNWDPKTESISDICLLHEPWNSERPAGWHLVLVIQNGNGSRLAFVPLAVQNTKLGFEDLRLTKKITAVTTHGHDSLLFLGDEAGGVSVWFVSPTLDRAPRELFTFPGHRGAGILDIRLSADGNALLTSDSQRRSLRWPSSIQKTKD